MMYSPWLSSSSIFHSRCLKIEVFHDDRETQLSYRWLQRLYSVGTDEEGSEGGTTGDTVLALDYNPVK